MSLLLCQLRRKGVYGTGSTLRFLLAIDYPLSPAPLYEFITGPVFGGQVTLHGPAPSFTVSWEDTLGQAGALTFEEAQLPFPLPVVEGELCDLRMTSLGWTPGAVSGVVESECVTRIEHPVEFQTVAAHESVTETALMDAQVTAITGTVSAATGASSARVPFVPNGETSFRLGVPAGEAIHAVSVDVSLEAGLRIPIPPADRAHPPP